MRRHAEDRLNEAINGSGGIKAMILNRTLRDQLTRRQRLAFEALLADEQLLGTLPTEGAPW